MALIGTYNWNPVGESMWSIVTRLAQRNYLTWVEIRRLFGSKDLQSFKTAKTQSADVPHNFAIPGLCISTGWDLNALPTSFSREYRPPWLREDLSATRISERLRICPTCVKEGSHWITHQLIDWVRCPIHKEPLVTCCPKCGNELDEFLISNVIADRPGQCANCGELVFDSRAVSHTSQSARLTIISEYREWLNQVDREFRRDTGRHRWLTGPATTSELVHLHKLIPGPSWLNGTLAHGSRISKTSWEWRGESLRPARGVRAYFLPAPPKPNPYRLDPYSSGRPAIIYDFRRYLSNGVREHCNRIYELFEVSSSYSGVQEWSPNETLIQFGESVNASDTAFELWRRSVDEAFPDHHRWGRSRTPVDIEERWLWQSWWRTVGRLIWCPVKSLKRPVNAAFVRWATRNWLRRELEEYFALFMGVACRQIGAGWMSTEWLVNQTPIVGKPSFWVYEITPKQLITIHALSTIAPISDFLELKRSGFIGNGRDYFRSFEHLKPLINLLGTHPHEQREWEKHWQVTRQRLDGAGSRCQIDV